MRSWLRVLVPAASLLIGVLLVELVFGSWLRNPWSRVVALNVTLNERLTYDATDLYAGGGPVVYTRDRYGLRGRYGEPRDINILTVGGSTTDERYINDGETWQDELERQLRAAGKPATVANAGVTGHSTYGHLSSYLYWFPLIPGLRPRYTLLYLGINDFFLLQHVLYLDGPAGGVSPLMSIIKADSATWHLYRVVRGTVQAYRWQIHHDRVDFSRLHYTSAPTLPDFEPVGRSQMEAFRQRFVQLLDAVRRSGSTPVCITQPTRHFRIEPDGTVLGLDGDVSIEEAIFDTFPINGVDYFHLRRMLDDVILSECHAAGGPTIDMAVAPWEDADFYDFVHMTPHGVNTLGRRIAAAMVNLPW